MVSFLYHVRTTCNLMFSYLSTGIITRKDTVRNFALCINASAASLYTAHELRRIADSLDKLLQMMETGTLACNAGEVSSSQSHLFRYWLSTSLSAADIGTNCCFLVYSGIYSVIRRNKCIGFSMLSAAFPFAQNASQRFCPG